MEREEFIELYKINVNDKVDKKGKLKYLSWSYAWYEFKKKYPMATYEIKMFDWKPYVYDENLWYMVFTSVNVSWLIHDMRLPVMDWANRSMLNHTYTYKVKDNNGEYVEKTVQPATMFDINKTIMRCLTKNLAMFWLWLYIYNWEDLPEVEEERPAFNEETWKWFWNNQDKYKSADEAIEKIEKKYTLSEDFKERIRAVYSITNEKWEEKQSE